MPGAGEEERTGTELQSEMMTKFWKCRRGWRSNKVEALNATELYP